MKKFIILLGAFFICLQIGAQDTQTNVSTYYLIRHAEKDRTDKTNQDPNLKQKGLARALEWARVFKDVSFDEIYATPYRRTRQTAEPTAFLQKKKITEYNPSNLDFDEFKAATKGKTVLIVGHSNTTPNFANALIGEERFEAMKDTDNASLFIITVIDGKATGIRLMID